MGKSVKGSPAICTLTLMIIFKAHRVLQSVIELNTTADMNYYTSFYISFTLEDHSSPL